MSATVMYVGKTIEVARSSPILCIPLHGSPERPCWSRIRASARSTFHCRTQWPIPSTRPSECYVHPRCQYAESICKTEAPELQEVQPHHFVSCHRAEEITLQGVTQTLS